MKQTMSLAVAGELRSDVLVVGGGPSGIAAAAGAARCGAEVLLVENAGFLGGAATLNLVPNFCPFSAGQDGKTVFVGGPGREILDRLRDAGGAVQQLNNGNYWDWLAIDPEIYKVVLDDYLSGLKIRVLLQTPFVGVEADGPKVDAVALVSRRGLLRACAGAYVDATGDGDLYAAAGAPFDFGDAEGRVMGVTQCFRLDGLSRTAFEDYLRKSGDAGYLPDAMIRARRAGDLTHAEHRVGALMFTDEHTATVNAGHVWDVDTLDPEDISRAEREGRKVARDFTRVFRRHVPGMEEARLVASGPQVGKRESRRLAGRARVTLPDYKARRKRPDDIGSVYYFLDLHAAVPDYAIPEVTRDEDKAEMGHYRAGETFGIPYGCLLARENAANVVAAGRSISTDRDVHAAARVMPCCFVTGHAAGVAAALASGGGVTPERVEVGRLRAVLREQGAYLVDPESPGDVRP